MAHCPGFALQNLVCCRSELSFSTDVLILSTIFLATDWRGFSSDRELLGRESGGELTCENEAQGATKGWIVAQS